VKELKTRLTWLVKFIKEGMTPIGMLITICLIALVISWFVYTNKPPYALHWASSVISAFAAVMVGALIGELIKRKRLGRRDKNKENDS
jgi:hypothetical protein